MQQFILPDYLDRSKISKCTHLQSISYACALTDYMKIVDDKKVNIDFGNENPFIDGIPLKEFLPYVAQDESVKIFLRAYKAYKDSSQDNYLFTKNLVDALSETKLDIKCKYLPKEFTAFLDLKGLHDHDGDKIEGIFIDITQKPIPMVYLGCIAKDTAHGIHTISHLNIPLGDIEGNSLENIVKNYKEVSSVMNPETMAKLANGEDIDILANLEKKVEKADYHKHLHAIFNAVLYITHSPELCLEQENEFSLKKSKLTTQKNIFTSKKFFLMGRNFSLPKEYTCGEVGVSGHWRWQPHGPNRSLIKHIFIEPHKRNYGKENEICQTTL